MSEALVADDTLYEDMFDVRTEAQAAGTFLEADVNGGFNRLREAAPVHKGFLRELLDLPQGHKRYSEEHAGYTSFSFEACNAAFRDNETFSSRLYAEMPGVQAAFGGKSILEMGGDEHRRYRATMQPLFLKPRAFTWWRERWINEIVSTLVGRLKTQDRADLNLQLCARMPVHVASQGAGLEGEDALALRRALLTLMGLNRAGPQAGLEATQTIGRILEATIARRRADPRDDVISGMIAAELELEDGTTRPLTNQEIAINCRLFLTAGGGTTWRQLGITLWALLSQPDQWASLKADRGLIEGAIDESARWNPTDPYFSRLVTRDAVLDGVEIPAGAVLDICLGAGNRDPKRWDDPDAYDLHRPFHNHLGFSLGPHQCLGMNVAKSEMIVAINALLDNFPSIRADFDAPTPQLMGSLEGRGMTTVPVLLS